MQINSTNMLELTSGNNESVEAAAIMPRNYEVVPSKDERNYTEEQLAQEAAKVALMKTLLKR